MVLTAAHYLIAERAILYAEGVDREDLRKCAIRRLQRRLDLRDIATAWIQLYVPACTGRTLRLAQRADEGMGRDDEGAARPKGRSRDRRSHHHVRARTGCGLHDAVHAFR